MSITVVVTRDVPARIRRLLGSTMLKLAPGIHSAPRLSPAVRDRVWKVLKEWFNAIQDGSIIMLWEDKSLPVRRAARAGYQCSL